MEGGLRATPQPFRMSAPPSEDTRDSDNESEFSNHPDTYLQASISLRVPAEGFDFEKFRSMALRIGGMQFPHPDFLCHGVFLGSHSPVDLEIMVTLIAFGTDHPQGEDMRRLMSLFASSVRDALRILWREYPSSPDATYVNGSMGIRLTGLGGIPKQVLEWCGWGPSCSTTLSLEDGVEEER